MAELREGAYGEYYGCRFNESHPLTRSQMERNAEYVYDLLSASGWSLEAICAVLGNMEHESSINPGRWQSDKPGATSSGYSLVQWTPASKYIDWCPTYGYDDPSEMDAALTRLCYEVQFNVQYYQTPAYPLTFKEFTQSTEPPYTLACAFAWNYERSYTVLYGTAAEKEALRKKRGGAAESWYTYLTGREPARPGKKKKGMSLLMMYLATRRRV